MPAIKTLLLFCIVLLPAFNAQTETSSADAMQGVDYDVIEPAQPVAVPAGKIEVIEMFWYGCPHCFEFEPYIQSWLKQKPDNIVFKRMPAILNPGWESHARTYFAAELLGITQQIHEPFFIALHEEKKKLFSEKAIADFVMQLGVDRKKFTDAYRSFTVSTQVRKSKKLTAAYKLNGVPSMVIHGKYITSSSRAGGHANVITVMNALAETELKSLVAEPAAQETKDKQP